MQEASHQKVQEQINYRSGAEKTLSCVIEMGGMGSMALPVTEFQDQGYKIRKIFA